MASALQVAAVVLLGDARFLREAELSTGGCSTMVETPTGVLERSWANMRYAIE